MWIFSCLLSVTFFPALVTPRLQPRFINSHAHKRLQVFPRLPSVTCFFPRLQHVTCFLTLETRFMLSRLCHWLKTLLRLMTVFLQISPPWTSRPLSIFFLVLPQSSPSRLNFFFQIGVVHRLVLPLVFVPSWLWYRFLWVLFVSSAPLFCNPKQTWISQALDSSSLNHKSVFPRERKTA